MPGPNPAAILVTGSRSLWHRVGAEAWEKGVLSELCGRLPPHSILIHGGAEGPDLWAHDVFYAAKLGDIHVHKGTGHGYVAIPGRGVQRIRWSYDIPDPTPKWAFLYRNRYMVNEVLYPLRELYDCEAYAFLDPDSTTGGTGATIRALNKNMFQFESTHGSCRTGNPPCLPSKEKQNDHSYRQQAHCPL